MPKKLRVYSHDGCLRCRLRRKKCDEQRPICGNCQRTGLTCVWKSVDNPSVHLFHVNKSLAILETTLRVKDENCDYTTYFTPLEHTPLGRTLSSFAAIRNGNEHELLSRLSGFLTMLSPSKKEEVVESNNHVFGIGLQNLWVRNALVAFAAFAFSARDQSLRGLAYNAYQTSIEDVQTQIAVPRYTEYSEELLVATLFLGLVEVNNPENLVFPLLHFEAVGHLLNQVAARQVSGMLSASIFHRIASEAYLYHVSILSLYYPQTNRFTTLSTAVVRHLDMVGSKMADNMIIGMDINIYRILFEVTLLGRADRSSLTYLRRVEAVDSALRDVFRRTNLAISAPNLAMEETEFWKLTALACEVLHIYLIKVREPSTLARDETVRAWVTPVIKSLESLSISREWTGNLVWILAILLCAAHTVSDVASIDRKVEELKGGIWGADLLRLTQTVRKVRSRREQSYRPRRITGESDALVSSDTLALLLNDNGILADD